MKIDARQLLGMGLMFARVWRGQTVGIAPTERLKLRRQMAAAAAGKKESASLSLVLELNKIYPPWPHSLGRRGCG